MVDDEVIWSEHHLSFGTGWLVYDYTLPFKDLLTGIQLPVGLTEANVGSFLELQHMIFSREILSPLIAYI